MINKALTILLGTLVAYSSQNEIGDFSQVSSGCGSTSKIASGQVVDREITINDPAMGETLKRSYQIKLPKNYDSSKKYPVIVYFHGWMGSASNTPYNGLPDREDVITVSPQGMSDYLFQWTPFKASWNIGDSGNTNTCSDRTGAYCYKSCSRLNKCSKCSCFTCYDDLYFVRQFMDEINQDFCVDNKRVMASGMSNGGMFTYYIQSHLADIFNSWTLIAGQPLITYLAENKGHLKDNYILSIHGKSDGILPLDGGIDSSNAWIYESVEEMFEGYGLEQGCDMDSWQKVSTPFDHEAVLDAKNLECHEYVRGCQGRVMSCLHDGGHVQPSYSEGLTWWFWNTSSALPNHATSNQKEDQKPEIIQN